MEKYRIVKEITSRMQNIYHIQKRFLFWYFDYKFYVLNCEKEGDNYYKQVIYVNTFEEAKDQITKAKYPFIKFYKGCKIIQLYRGEYMNISRRINNKYYNWSYNLHTLYYII